MILFVLLIIFCYARGEDDEILQKCYKECGLDNRVFGEKRFEGFPHAAPFTGQLVMSYKPCRKFEMKCSAIIIDEKFIITAKSSIRIKEQTYFSPADIKFSTPNNGTDKNATEKFFQIKTLLPLTYRLAKLDAVLLELSENMEFSIERRAACLFGGYTPNGGDVLRFAGYGKIPDVSTTNDSVITTHHLHQLNLSVQSEAFCDAKYVGNPADYFCVKNNLTIGDTGGGAYLVKNGRLYSVAIAAEAGMIFDSRIIHQELSGRLADLMLSISPAMCKSIERTSKGKVHCSSSFSPPPEECINRLEKEQKILAEAVQEENSQDQ